MWSRSKAANVSRHDGKQRQEDNKETLTRYTYNASFVAPLIVGVVRVGVVGLTYPSYSLFSRWRTLVSASSGVILAQVSLLGCYSMFSGPSKWTEESCAEEIRALGACWETSISLLMSLIMNLSVSMLLCALKAWLYVLFAALTLGMRFSIYKFLPERKKKDGEGDLLKPHWFWKRFLQKDGNVDAV
ncbi:PREDICTED: sugar transport protein 10-like [Nicotiana attenuata]|uniref:sugar transport protein 10-like n=1 Tax=Nicotiana attenuata TaxID=49451 RepID=UPI000905AEAA|nr:PREDICTED: sugar transport protein 10-like [Nicotiana attenuata]